MSCERHKTNDVYEKIELDKQVKSHAIKLEGQEVDLGTEYLYASRYMVYRDTILILCNKDNNEVKLLELYNMNNGELINSYFRKGRGPGELISSKYTLNEDLLVIDDFQNDWVAFMHLDSALIDPEYIPKLQKYNYQSLTIMEDKNGKILILNPYCFKDDVAKIDNNAPRFIITEDNEKATKNRYKYNTYNVVDGYIIANYEKDRVVFASMTAPPTIEIYDGDLNKLKELSGPENFEVKYHIEDKWVSYYGGTPISYYGSTLNDENFFVLYYGKIMGVDGKMNKWKPYLFVFDWEGNFQKSYLLDRYVYCLSISQDGSILYATGHDKDNMPKLYQYNLK